MKRLILLCLALLVMSCGEKAPAEDDWYQPTDGKTLIQRFSLDAGSTREVNIPSTTPLDLYIESNATVELALRYEGSFPVWAKHRQRIESIGTVMGAGGALFIPVDGEIPLLIGNDTDTELEIALSKTD
jgi:hypothetical protein